MLEHTVDRSDLCNGIEQTDEWLLVYIFDEIDTGVLQVGIMQRSYCSLVESTQRYFSNICLLSFKKYNWQASSFFPTVCL